MQQEKEIQLRIPPGVETGSRLRLGGQGEAGGRGGPRGDLYVFVRVREHEYFERDGRDVHCRFPVSFAQAALGAQVKVPGLSGHETLRIPAGTQNGRAFRIRGKGIRPVGGGGVGDQVVHVQVQVPRRLSKKQRELIQQLADTEPDGLDVDDKKFFHKVKQLFS